MVTTIAKPKSRTLVLQLKTGPNVLHAYYLRGVNKIGYNFESSIGETQGLMQNFIHPWFFKVFDIEIAGSTFIGAYKGTIDSSETYTPALPQSESATNAQTQAQSLKKELTQAPQKIFNYFSKSVLDPKYAMPQQGTYYRMYQWLKIVEDLGTISQSIQDGSVRHMNVADLEQVLTIGGYYDQEDKPAQFTGFVKSVSFDEESSRLGKINYTLHFSGILAQLSAETKGKTKAATSKSPTVKKPTGGKAVKATKDATKK